MRVPRLLGLAQIAQNGARGICTGRSHHSASGMSAGAAHVHAAHRSTVLRVARDGAVEEQLIESELTLEDIAFGKADLILDVPRSADLSVQNELFEIRTVLGDGIDDRLA